MHAYMHTYITYMHECAHTYLQADKKTGGGEQTDRQPDRQTDKEERERERQAHAEIYTCMHTSYTHQNDGLAHIQHLYTCGEGGGD